nr:NAD-dependent epimerase/dehydratase family protein [uncultured Clostridium sp.]
MDRNVLEAAAECGVKKVVYVSSMAALDRTKIPMDEDSWGTEFPNPYYKAKNDAEKSAWEIAEELNLWMVAILPSRIIGTNTYGHLSATNALLNTIVKNRLPFDPNFSFNFVHAKDVAKGMILAAQKGKNGERYILATEPSISTTKIINMARDLLINIKELDIIAKEELIRIAMEMEEESRMTHKPPLLLVGNVMDFYEADGYNPLSPEQAIKEVLLHFSKENF